MILLLLAVLTPTALAQKPTPDQLGPFYFSWLQHSQTPTARIMRRAIYDGPHALTQECSLARRGGIPLTPSQLQKPLPLPGQNAAPLYVKLTKLLQDKPLHLPDYADKGMDAFYSYTPEQIAAVRKIFADRQDLMMLVHQAADKPKCVFVREWDKGTDVTFPEDPALRVAARLLRTESYLLAREGRYQEAVTHQARGFQVARHAASDAAGIPYLVGTACEAITLSGMQSLLQMAGPNVAIDAQIQKTVSASLPTLSLHDALAGEPAIMGVEYHKMRHLGRYGVLAMLQTGKLPVTLPSSLKPASSADRRFTIALVDAWQANYLQQMRRLVSASTLPTQKRRIIFDSAAQKNLNNPANFVKLLAYIILLVYARMDGNDTRIRARESVTLAAAALLGAKANSGAFPDKLPPEFTDPFTNKPLQYRREGANGFVVYSVGPTGQFDGGKPGQRTPSTESLFRYPVVPLPPN